MLAVAGGKGGCGKTTTALGLARALARQGQTPLVLDGDCDMPDLHLLADIDRDDGVDALARGAPLSRVCRRPDAFPGVAVVTAGRPARVGPALRATRDWTGPVLVDCPAGIGPDATRPLREADATLVVSTDDPQSVDDTRRTVTAARELGAPPAGVILRTTGDSPARVADCPVLATVPGVAEPLRSRHLARVWRSIADQLFETPDPESTRNRARARSREKERTRLASGDGTRGRTRRRTVGSSGGRPRTRAGSDGTRRDGRHERHGVERSGGDTPRRRRGRVSDPATR